MSYKYPDFSKYFVKDQLPTEIMMIIHDFCRLSIKKRALFLPLKPIKLTLVEQANPTEPYIFLYRFSFDSSFYLITIRPFNEEFRQVKYFSRRHLFAGVYFEQHPEHVPFEINRYYLDSNYHMKEIQTIKPGVRISLEIALINEYRYIYTIP